MTQVDAVDPLYSSLRDVLDHCPPGGNFITGLYRDDLMFMALREPNGEYCVWHIDAVSGAKAAATIVLQAEAIMQRKFNDPGEAQKVVSDIFANEYRRIVEDWTTRGKSVDKNDPPAE